MRELTVAETMVYEAVGDGHHLQGIINVLGETSIQGVPKILNYLVDVGLLVVKQEGYRWRSLTIYEYASPVAIVKAKRLRAAREAELESKRILTPYEKNALIIAKRKGLYAH